MAIEDGRASRSASLLRKLRSVRRGVSNRGQNGSAPPKDGCSPIIYQYWDSPNPPAEVVANIKATQEAVPAAKLVLLDKGAAERLIAFQQGARALAAFRACGPPAMQADYLRLCIMDSLGGFYLDVDEVVLKSLAGLIDDVPAGLIFKWLCTVGNSVLFFRTPKHPFIRACLELATENIEARRFDSVLLSTGPGLLTSILYAGDDDLENISRYILSHSKWKMDQWSELLTHARRVKKKLAIMEDDFRDLKIMDVSACMEWVENRNMKYKSSVRHWENWSDDIYISSLL